MVRPGMSGGGFHGGRGLGGLGTESEPGIEELVRTSSLNFLPNVHLVDRHPYLMGVGEQKASEKRKPSALLSCTLKIVLVCLFNGKDI